MDEGGLPERLIAVCCLALIMALFIVGQAADEQIRHLIQIAPVCVVAVFGFRGSDLAKWAGAALFLFWGGIVTLITLHLTGVAHVINGEFSPTEVSMVWVMGVACALGLGLAVMAKGRSKPAAAIAVFVLMAALLVGDMWVSLLPSFAHDDSLHLIVD